LPVRYRRPNQPVHVLDGLDLRLNDTHPTFTIPPASLSPLASTIYNTVVLVGAWEWHIHAQLVGLADHDVDVAPEIRLGDQ
jgi:hypothetical protein